MVKYRKAEPVGLIAALVVVGAMSPFLPGAVRVGSLAAGLGLALLLQGLVRDLFTLAESAAARRSGEAQEPMESRACMCLESLIGLPVVLGGLALGLAWSDRMVAVAPWAWVVLAGGVLGLGYAMRDLVLEWHPRWRIARVENHGSILVQWRAGRG